MSLTDLNDNGIPDTLEDAMLRMDNISNMPSMESSYQRNENVVRHTVSNTSSEYGGFSRIKRHSSRKARKVKKILITLASVFNAMLFILLIILALMLK